MKLIMFTITSTCSCLYVSSKLNLSFENCEVHTCEGKGPQPADLDVLAGASI